MVFFQCRSRAGRCRESECKRNRSNNSYHCCYMLNLLFSQIGRSMAQYSPVEARWEEDPNRSEDAECYGKRPGNPVEGACTYTPAICFSANLVQGRRESMLCPPIEGNSQKKRGLHILHPSASGYAVIREDDHMTRYKWLQEENFSSKRIRYNRAEREKQGVVQESYENVSAAVQSDSMLKVSSGDSEITAEQMAERSSGTTSSSDNNGCTLKLDLPPSCRKEASKAAIDQKPYTVKEKSHGTFSDSGLHKSNLEESQAMHRSERFCSSLWEPVSEKNQDWLALGLGCGQSKHLSNKPHLDMAKDVNASIITWNEDKIKNDQLQLLSQTFNAGHKSKLTTQLPPSSSAIQARLFSIPNIYNSVSPPLHKADKSSLQKHSCDSSNFSALNPLQHSTMQDQQRSQNIEVFPSIEQLYLNFQGQASGVRPWQSKQAAYDRISEVGFCEPRVAGSTHGIRRFSPGRKNINTSTIAALPPQNSDIHASATGLLQQAIREKMQCNALDNFPLWANQEINLEPLIRPSESEITSTKISPPDRTQPFRQQQYSVHALLSDRNMAQGPSSEAQRVLDSSWTEKVKILRPRPAAQTSVWFALHPLKDQNGDHMLPQIRKNYLRIKDGTTTILVLKKYLVNKLGLNSESEIEIMCKGEQLLPSLTLQHVRDVMWLPSFKDDDEVSNYSSTAHLMVLHYQRNRAHEPAFTTQFQPR